MQTKINNILCNYKSDSNIEHNFPAKYYCSECNKKLCETCTNEHNIKQKNHKIENFKEIVDESNVKKQNLFLLKELLVKCNFLNIGTREFDDIQRVETTFMSKFDKIVVIIREIIKSYNNSMTNINRVKEYIKDQFEKLGDDPMLIRNFFHKDISEDLINVKNSREKLIQSFNAIDNLYNLVEDYFEKINNKEIKKETNIKQKQTDENNNFLAQTNKQKIENGFEKNEIQILKDLLNQEIKKTNLSQNSEINNNNNIKNNKINNKGIKENNSINQNKEKILTNYKSKNQKLSKDKDEIQNKNLFNIFETKENKSVINTNNNTNEKSFKLNDTIKQKDKNANHNNNDANVNKEKKIKENNSKSIQDTVSSSIELNEQENLKQKKNQLKNKFSKNENNINIVQNLKKRKADISKIYPKNLISKNDKTNKNENINDNILNITNDNNTSKQIETMFHLSEIKEKNYIIFGLSSNDDDRCLVACYSTKNNKNISIHHIKKNEFDCPINFDKKLLKEFPYFNSKIVNLINYSIIIGGKRKEDTDKGNNLCFKLEFNFNSHNVKIFPFPNTKYSHQEHSIIFSDSYSIIIALSGKDQKMCEYFSLNDNNKKWKKLPRLPSPRKNAICFLINERYIIIIGGKDDFKENINDYILLDLKEVMKNKMSLWKTIKWNKIGNLGICNLAHPGIINMDKEVLIFGGEGNLNIWKIKFDEKKGDSRPAYYSDFFDTEKNLEIASIELCRDIKTCIKSCLDDLMMKNSLMFFGEEKFYKFKNIYVNISLGGGVKYISKGDLEKYD